MLEVHVCNSALGRLRQEDPKLEASLDYMLNSRQPGLNSKTVLKKSNVEIESVAQGPKFNSQHPEKQNLML
jgi:hypothetical protein